MREERGGKKKALCGGGLELRRYLTYCSMSYTLDVNSTLFSNLQQLNQTAVHNNIKNAFSNS